MLLLAPLAGASGHTINCGGVCAALGVHLRGFFKGESLSWELQRISWLISFLPSALGCFDFPLLVRISDVPFYHRIKVYFEAKSCRAVKR